VRVRAIGLSIYVDSWRVATLWHNALEIAAMGHRICWTSPDANRQFRPPRIIRHLWSDSCQVALPIYDDEEEKQ
jgi:hypothetical protein